MEKKVPSHLNSAIASSVQTLDLIALIENCDDVNSPDVNGNSPLHAAIQHGRVLKVIKALVAKGAKLEARDSKLRTPLQVAFYFLAKKGVILYLLRNTENVNITDDCQRTLFHVAIETYRDQVFGMLIKKGANFEALDNTGRTPLHVAMDKGLYQGWYFIHRLLKMTKNVNSTDSYTKRTLLHAAIAESWNPKLIRTLIERGANLGAQDGQGRTPLHSVFNLSRIRYEKEMTDLYLFLIKNATDINGLDKYNKTPLYYAFLQRHRPLLIRALVENGADFNRPDSTVFRLAADEERRSLLTEAFPEELKGLKKITLYRGTTLYGVLVLQRHHDWNCVDRPLECLTERNKPFWSVIMSSIVAQRSYSLRLHSSGIRLDEDSTLHVISFLQSFDVISLLLAFKHCLYLKRRSDSSLSLNAKRQKVV